MSRKDLHADEGRPPTPGNDAVWVTHISPPTLPPDEDLDLSYDVENEWPLDTDGYPHRTAARVILLDPEGRIYLIRGHDIDSAGHSWWFTPGGGLNPGESALAGALRELWEETGLHVAEERLQGPILERLAVFKFLRRTRKQDEYFFLLHVTSGERELIDSGKSRQLTETELNLLDEFRWFSVAELETKFTPESGAAQTVYPTDLAQRLPSWQRGWDGSTPRIVET